MHTNECLTNMEGHVSVNLHPKAEMLVGALIKLSLGEPKAESMTFVPFAEEEFAVSAAK